MSPLFSPLIRCFRSASDFYSSFPVSEMTKFRTWELLAKYAPWLLRRLFSDLIAPVPQLSFVGPHEVGLLRDGTLQLATSMEPVVSVVIAVYGKLDYTLRCLASIALNPPAVPFEIVVVDDASPDASHAVLSGIAGVKLISNPGNLGFIRSCNTGARAAAGSFLCFLNNDTEVAEGWLDELWGTFREFPGTGLCGSKLVYPDGTLQEAGGIIWRDGSAWNFGRNRDQCEPAFNYAREVDYCSGASIMVDRELFEQLGGFDEHYLPAYCEDSDLALKIRQRGLRVMYQPLSVVVHHEGVSSGTDLAAGVKACQVENSRKLFERWRERLSHHQVLGTDVDSAKDRGCSRRVLVIDHCVPTPDQDAGSVTVFNLLLLLREMGFQVTFIPEINFNYVEGYTPALQRAGVEVLYGPQCMYMEKHLKQAGGRYDLVLMIRPVVVARHLRLVRKHCPRAKVLFHTIDLHFLRLSREAELSADPAKRAEAAQMKATELAALRSVDASIVHSTTELDMLRTELPTEAIHVFPLILDVRGSEVGFASRRDIVFVGGYRHLPNVDAVNYFVAEVMPLLRLLLPGVRFHAVGSNPTSEMLAMQCEDVIVTGFVDDIDPLLDTMRLSVAPLRFGAGIKGKIGTALALGLPTVATSLGAEGMSLTDGENIIVADGAEAFADACTRLYQDRQLWEQVSRCGVDFAEQAWGAEAAWRILHEILNGLGMSTTRGDQPLRLYSPRDGRKFGRPGSGPGRAEGPMPVGNCDAENAFREILSGEELRRLAMQELRFLSRAGGRESFTVPGFCIPCGREVSFLVDLECGGRAEGGRLFPNWRERLVCPHCGMNNRQRLIASLVARQLGGTAARGSSVYFLEQVTPIYHWAQAAFPECRIIGSEYLGPRHQPGTVVKGIRHEDAGALSFPDSSFDLVVSNDVFEHVPEPGRSFSECARVLRPGGVLLATIPFHDTLEESVVRARLDGEEVSNLLPPLYHGNPVSSSGSLVFTDFGWDVLDTIRSSGFQSCSCEIYASDRYGHLGGGQPVFRAVKPATPAPPEQGG
ncbi:MAG: glycosyltransferase [Deltaproteobacteria bacterium]|nr:glycosyltransferase [Deltaproteobacteria bacterium]TLN02260.1 MAG: glycosyltransferase [bacterium]